MNFGAEVRERWESLFSRSSLPTNSPLRHLLLPLVPVADGGSLPVGRHPVSSPFPSLCPLMLRSLPLPPCFISSVYRWVAAGPGDSNRWLWVSSASLERWRCRGEPDLSWRRRQAGRSRVSPGVDLGQISPGGFAGVALRRCLRRSGQYTASTVSPLSPLAMLW